MATNEFVDFLRLVLNYANVNDYMQACTGPCELDPSLINSVSNRPEWAGSKSMEETLNRVTKGYPEGVALARKLSLRLTPFLRTVKSYKRSWVAGRHAGGSFIMDSYNKGLPDCCMNMAHVVSKKFVNIIINGAVSGGIAAEILAARGAAVVALVDALQSQNYRVSVKVCYGISYGAYKTYTMIAVKEFNQPMELDRLAFFIGDPSALRRLYFAFAERQPAEIRDKRLAAGHGNGRPLDLPASMIAEKDLYLGSASVHEVQWSDLDKCQEWLKETMRRYGVEFTN